MNKITLAGTEYELPELNFGAMRKLGKLGFNFLDPSMIEDNFAEFLSIMVAYVTNNTLDDADKIIDGELKNGNFGDVADTLSKWFSESDFFKQLLATKK